MHQLLRFKGTESKRTSLWSVCTLQSSCCYCSKVSRLLLSLALFPPLISNLIFCIRWHLLLQLFVLLLPLQRLRVLLLLLLLVVRLLQRQHKLRQQCVYVRCLLVWGFGLLWVWSGVGFCCFFLFADKRKEKEGSEGSIF